MAVLIDSSVFIAAERRGLRPADLVLFVPDEPVALAAVSASELLFGVERANTPERRLRRERFVEALFAAIPIFSFGLAEARVHGRLWAPLAASGQIIGAHDLLSTVPPLYVLCLCGSRCGACLSQSPGSRMGLLLSQILGIKVQHDPLLGKDHLHLQPSSQRLDVAAER